MTNTQVHEATVASGAPRWAQVGRSTDSDSFVAGASAVAEANGREDVSLYVVFAGHRHDHERLMAGVASRAAAHATVVGCTTGGEIAGGGPSDDGVVVMALGGSDISTAARSVEIVGGDLRTAGEWAADAIWDVEDRGHTVLLLLSDGLAGDQQEVISGAFAAAGATVPLVGGCAGGGLDMDRPTLFHATSAETRIGGSQVIGVAISSTEPLGVGVSHGLQSVGEPMRITRAAGDVVLAIDEEPALDRYLRLHGAPADLAEDPEAFARFAANHPIGISRRSGQEIRVISGADPLGRSLTSAASVPEGAVAHAMEGTAASLLDAAGASCAQALGQLSGPPLAVLAFDCVARRGVIGEGGIIDEVARLNARAGAPVAGFYAYGEFARVSGASGFHNQTVVTLAIG